ncbi:MAG: YeeE/YedE family protein [Deltaproteobacteria bacterium]|nr:YeeE/YedE family protein [Deltaproteobacteria bacterium]
MGPFAHTMEWGTTTVYVVSFIIGIGFGAALEMAGFGDSRKLTGQFYLRDMTVLKVMFGAVVMAAVLLGLFSAFGWIDMSLVWINPTYLWPGIVGGLVMGVGFMIGGFCPGTSVVAASTLKVDGIVFLIGVGIGIFVFGLTLPQFEGFWLSSNYGHITLPEVFHVSKGVVLIAVVFVGLFSFMLAELSEAKFGEGMQGHELHILPRRPLSWAAVGLLIVAAGAAALKGEPTGEDLWLRIAPTAEKAIKDRTVYVHPLEVAEITRNTDLYTVVLDVRDEADFNLFHLRESRRVTQAQLDDPGFVKKLSSMPDNTVFFTVSWDETAATEAWKKLKARGLANVYIVEGGINNWHRIFPVPPCLGKPAKGKHEDETPYLTYFRAVGDCCNTAYPEVAYKQIPTDCYLEMTHDPHVHSAAGSKEPEGPDVKFKHKVKLKKKRAVTGGCG